MIRLVLLLALALAGAVALWKLYRMIRARRPDWAGIAFILAFVALAVWLRNETGIGGLAD